MLKKRRSRLLWGSSSLSALYLSCGVMFIMGNVYILHSGFSQAYSNLQQEDRDFILLRQQPDEHHTGEAVRILDGWEGEKREMEGVLKDLPRLALAAFGYHQHLDVPLLQQNLEHHRSPLPVLLGASDTRLRKLMENPREGLQAEAFPVPPSNKIKDSNIGRKQRTEVRRGGEEEPNPLSSPHLVSLHGHPHPDRNVLRFEQHSDQHSADNNPRLEDAVLLDTLHNEKYMGIDEIRQVIPHTDVVDIPVTELRRLLGHGSQCGLVRNLTGKEYISSGWTKTVHRAHLPGLGGPDGIAVKSVDMTGHDVTSCIKEARSQEFCYNRASQKLMKEIVLLKSFNNSHIIKMLGYCVPKKPYDGDADGLVSMVTELGETIDIIKLLQMSWEDRLRVSYGITELLQYLANSPFGTVALNDFRRQQFILVNGDLVLTDVDDIGVGEPRCESEADCLHYFSSANFTLRTPCRYGRCEGFNEKKNTFNAARHFTTFLLPHGAPPSMKPAINRIIDAYSNATSSASRLLDWLDDVVEKYRRGEYVKRSSGEQINRYQVQRDADLPGLHDYRCRFSIASIGCTLSVLDQREAEQLCDLDPECRGFVISDKRTWAGRMLVHLKNNVTSAVATPGLTLCRKPVSRV